MADNFTMLPPDSGSPLTREELVAALYIASQNVQSGSKAIPGFAFLNDQTCGFYLYSGTPIGSSAIGMVIDGVEVATFTKTGLTLQVPAAGLLGATETSTTISAPGSTYTLSFAATGDATFIIVPNAPLTLSLNTLSLVAGTRQVLHIIISQPSTGGFPVTLQMPTVRFPRNAQGVPSPVTISSSAGNDTPLTLVGLGDANGTIAGYSGF